jgi:voltage-gated potassium channel
VSPHALGAEGRRERWVDATSRPLAIAGVLFVVLYTVWVLWEHPPDWMRGVYLAVFTLAWVAFVADVVVQFLLTPRGQRMRWVWRHPVEVLSAFLPLARALRVVSLVRHLPALERRTTSAVRARFVSEALTYAAVFVFFIALATYQAERHASGATIVTFGDAIWWALVTLATVGYGDTYPVTALGRTYAVILMAGGVAIVGTASATLVSILNERMQELRRGPGAAEPVRSDVRLLDQPSLDEPEPEEPSLDADGRGAAGAVGRTPAD